MKRSKKKKMIEEKEARRKILKEMKEKNEGKEKISDKMVSF